MHENVKFITYIMIGIAVLCFFGWLTVNVAKVFLFIGVLFFIWGVVKIKKFL